MTIKELSAETGVTVKSGVLFAAVVAVVGWFAISIIEIKTDLVVMNITMLQMQQDQSSNMTKAEHAMHEQKRARQMGVDPITNE